MKVIKYNLHNLVPREITSKKRTYSQSLDPYSQEFSFVPRKDTKVQQHEAFGQKLGNRDNSNSPFKKPASNQYMLDYNEDKENSQL